MCERAHRNHSTLRPYGPPPVTKCHRMPSDSTRPAPIAAMPYTEPLPGVRLPKNRVSSADANGSSATSQAYRSSPADPDATSPAASASATT